ncbi:hypothetical protein P20429_0917 [Pseudoalteromonas sp. BSi20429]|nr:hypothetical protein P20429_0917 [Pseudoalteromonas sp. BSi20429]
MFFLYRGYQILSFYLVIGNKDCDIYQGYIYLINIMLISFLAFFI